MYFYQVNFKQMLINL